MDSLPVTLIVKAPNQQIEDQKITCETSWTINKLKEHLAEVYPNKPPQHEQKLIYSGQLLNDSLVLKDVLRQYEGQDTHTVHLVCTPKHTKMNRPKQSTRQSETSQGNTNVGSTNANTTSGNVSPETAAQNPQSISQNNTDQIPTADPNAGVANDGFRWMNGAGQLPQINMNNLNQYQLQMALMQQAYIQYMTQYMQLATGQAPTISTSNAFPTPNIPVNAPNIQPNQPEAAQEAAPPNPPAQPQLENEERDWLDVFYMLSRAMVLFSVVYFYSSPVRFIFVLFLGIALYLYQTGFFRNININNNNINGTPNGIQEEEQAPTRFMVAWTFIATFFASLIPEIPNINA